MNLVIFTEEILNGKLHFFCVATLASSADTDNSQTLTIHMTVGERREATFTPLCYFHPLTNIQTFICNFGYKMSITYFWSQRLYLRDCNSMRFTTLLDYHLTDWWCNVCLLTWWFDSRFSLEQFDKGSLWILTCTDYHPCITSKLTHQVY